MGEKDEARHGERQVHGQSAPVGDRTGVDVTRAPRVRHEPEAAGQYDRRRREGEDDGQGDQRGPKGHGQVLLDDLQEGQIAGNLVERHRKEKRGRRQKRYRRP